MKKIIPLCAASIAVLSGCIFPTVTTMEQPKYEYESYKPHKMNAVDRSAFDADVADYNQHSSFKMQEALRQSIVEVKQQYPAIFAHNNTFLVGSFVNADNINKSEKAGRISAMGLTDVIGKTAAAKYVRYQRNMLAVNNKMVVPTVEASKMAEIFKSDVIVMGVYKVHDYDLSVRYAFYDAKTRAYLGEGAANIPLDRNVTKFSSQP